MPARRPTGAVLAMLSVGLLVVWAISSSDGARTESHRAVAGWPALPSALELGEVSGIGLSSQDEVVVLHRAGRAWERGETPSARTVIDTATVHVLSAETGEVRDAWGAGRFAMPHGLTVDESDHVWVTDVALHQVFELDRDGTTLLTLGERGVFGDDSSHFDMPTDVAVTRDAVYVSDGYGNGRVVKFSRQGEFLLEWGTQGSAPGQLDVPHGIAVDREGRVYVADRGNARLQVFDGAGRLLDVWAGAEYGRPWAVRIGPDGLVYVVDGGDQLVDAPDRARIVVCDRDGTVLEELGSYGRDPGEFVWPHAVAVGGDGSLYVGEVSTGSRVQKLVPVARPSSDAP